MTPLLFLDLETTGLSPATHAPIEIAAVVCSGPHHGKEFHSKMRPFQGAIIDQRALAANGYTAREIMTWPDPAHVFNDFHDWINLISGDSEVVREAGYNYRFDRGFLQEWCIRYQQMSTWYGMTFAPDYIEVMKELKETFPQFASCWQRNGLGQGKLTYQYSLHFNEPLAKAHTAGADAHGTMRLFLHCDKNKSNPLYSHIHSPAPMIEVANAVVETCKSLITPEPLSAMPPNKHAADRAFGREWQDDMPH